MNSETDVLRGLYNFYSNIFNELPDKDRYLAQKDLLSTIEDDGTALAKGLSLMGACLSKTVDDTHVEALMVDWTRLFRGVAPDYGPLPPFESMWRKEDGILETLAGIYAAHGVSVEGGITTMPDYIGVELAFISFLLENGKERDAADFARQHPAVWIDDFCRKALEYAETDYYKGLLTSLPDLVKLFV